MCPGAGRRTRGAGQPGAGGPAPLSRSYRFYSWPGPSPPSGGRGGRRGLPPQLGVAEAVPGLEDQHLDHGDGVGVGSSSLGSVVQVEAIQDGSELLPVYVGFGFS